MLASAQMENVATTLASAIVIARSYGDRTWKRDHPFPPRRVACRSPRRTPDGCRCTCTQNTLARYCGEFGLLGRLIIVTLLRHGHGGMPAMHSHVGACPPSSRSECICPSTTVADVGRDSFIPRFRQAMLQRCLLACFVRCVKVAAKEEAPVRPRSCMDRVPRGA